MGEPAKRSYDATSRRAAAEATRDRICAAAEELFVRDGYARTSVRAVAKAAGVAEATVYNAFADKPALLNATILRAVRDNPSESLDAVAMAPPADILARLAASNAVLMERAGRLIALGDSAALMDADLRPFRAQAHARLRQAFRLIAERLDAAALLRLTVEEAADAIYGINTDATFLRMTEGVGLSSAAYADWLTDTLTAVLLKPAAAAD